jgi:hypothetical protein
MLESLKSIKATMNENEFKGIPLVSLLFFLEFHETFDTLQFLFSFGFSFSLSAFLRLAASRTLEMGTSTNGEPHLGYPDGDEGLFKSF